MKSLPLPCFLGSQFHLQKDRQVWALSLHRSKYSCSRYALKENCTSQRHFWLWDSYFPQGAVLTEPYSCNFMLTRQVLLTKVIHVLNQVQNKTAFIHYFYKAIMNDSLACDLFSKNYEPFTSLLVTWESFAFWFIVVFLGGLVPYENDQMDCLFPYPIFLRTTLSLLCEWWPH